MKRFLALAFVMLLGAGISHAEEPETAKELLASAVSQARMCGYLTEKFALDEQGKEHGPPHIDNKAGKMAGKLSLPIWFKPGRYELGSGQSVKLKDGSDAIAIHFWPKQKEKQLEPEPGEDAHYARGMNLLKGKVHIDPATGGLMAVEATLTEEFPYKILYLTVVRIRELSVSLKQKLQGNRWLPDSLEIRTRYWRSTFFKANLHERYSTNFTCEI